MKKFSLLFMVLVVVALVLAACGEGDNGKKAEDANSENKESDETTELEYEPEPIDPETDVCVVCGMAIADDEHATQIILKNRKPLKFDDIGDMFVWLDENGEDDIGAKFVRDFHTLEWILLENATFVYDEGISTPMGFGVISFKDSEGAEAYIEENGFGKLLSATDLYNHEWEMMMDHGHEGHDHGDHSHGDHDHGHGFHTEGFDMDFTELENATVGEETKLEVNITLDEAGLEGAKVRYEIWKEDNTDWVDASEANTGNYAADYTFKEAGTYIIQVHVEDDHDLHEHMEYEVIVKE